MFEDSNETGHSFGVLLNLLQPNVKSIARKIEKAQMKWVNCSYGVTFLNTCVYIYVYNDLECSARIIHIYSIYLQ